MRKGAIFEVVEVVLWIVVRGVGTAVLVGLFN